MSDDFEGMIIAALKIYHSPSERMVFVVDPTGSGGGAIFYCGDEEFTLDSKVISEFHSDTYTLDGIEDARKWLREKHPEDQECFDDLQDLEDKFNERMSGHIKDGIDAPED